MVRPGRCSLGLPRYDTALQLYISDRKHLLLCLVDLLLASHELTLPRDFSARLAK